MVKLRGDRIARKATIAAAVVALAAGLGASAGAVKGGPPVPRSASSQIAQLTNPWIGNWTAFDGGYRLNVSIAADRIAGKLYYQGYRFDVGGSIDAKGKVDGWATGVPWGTRYLRGTMPHLTLETLAKVNGAHFTLEPAQ
jgi:hypothetical protein